MNILCKIGWHNYKAHTIRETGKQVMCCKRCKSIPQVEAHLRFFEFSHMVRNKRNISERKAAKYSAKYNKLYDKWINTCDRMTGEEMESLHDLLLSKSEKDG